MSDREHLTANNMGFNRFVVVVVVLVAIVYDASQTIVEAEEANNVRSLLKHHTLHLIGAFIVAIVDQ